ncbi:hypothetical protein GCM10028801_45030 [Nocardioides maradonensis]
MKMRFLLPLFALLALGIAPVALPSSAQAATRIWAYQASAGGTYVQLGDGTVTSDLTAPSTVSGVSRGGSDANHTAAVNVANAVQTGAVQTKTWATKSGDTTTVHSWARTAGVDLLGGLVRIDAMTTQLNSSATTAGRTTGSGSTQFAGIHIAGVNLPLNIPKNYAVTVPGVATVSLNVAQHKVDATGSATLGWGLGITLLQPRAGMPANVTIALNPETIFFVDATPNPGAQLGGAAFGTRVLVNSGGLAKIESSPTALIGTPFNGSKGKTITHTTAAVNVPGLLTTGAVTTTTTSTKDAIGNANVRNTSQVAGLDLLGGLVKADAIHVVARGTVKAHRWTSGLSMSTVNLVIAGRSIPLNVAPNTTFDVAGLGKVELNVRSRNPVNRSNAITAIRITLGSPTAGFKAGAIIEIGYAATQIV